MDSDNMNVTSPIRSLPEKAWGEKDAVSPSGSSKHAVSINERSNVNISKNKLAYTNQPTTAVTPDPGEDSRMQVVRRGLWETAGKVPSKSIKMGSSSKRKASSSVSRHKKEQHQQQPEKEKEKKPTHHITRDLGSLAHIYVDRVRAGGAGGSGSEREIPKPVSTQKPRPTPTPTPSPVPPPAVAALRRGKSHSGKLPMDMSPSMLERVGMVKMVQSHKPSTAPEALVRGAGPGAAGAGAHSVGGAPPVRSQSPPAMASTTTTTVKMVASNAVDLYQRNNRLLQDENERLMVKLQDNESETQQLLRDLRRKDDEVNTLKGKMTRLNAQFQSQMAMFGKLQEENAELKLTRGRLVQKLKVEEDKVTRAKKLGGGGDPSDVKTAEALTKAALMQGRAAALEETLRQVKETQDTKEHLNSKLKERHEHLKKKFREMEVELLKSQREIKERDELMTRLNGVVMDLQDKLMGYERDHSHFQTKLGTLSKDLTTTGGETLQVLLSRLKVEEASVAKQLQKNRDLAESLSTEKSKNARLESELNKTRKALDQSGEEINALRVELKNAMERGRPKSRVPTASSSTSASPTKRERGERSGGGNGAPPPALQTSTTSLAQTFTESEVNERVRAATQTQVEHIEELRAKIRDLEKQIAADSAALGRIESQAKTLGETNRDLKAKLGEATQQLTKEKDESKLLTQQTKKLVSTNESLQSQVSSLKEQIETLLGAKTEDSKMQDILSKTRSDFEKECFERQKLIEQNKQLSEAVKRSEDRMRDFNVEMSSLRREFDANLKALQKLTAENDRNYARSKTLEDTLKTKDYDHKKEMDDLQKLARDKERELRAIRDRQHGPDSPSNKALEKERDARRKAENSLRELSGSLDEIRKEMRLMEERIDGLERTKFDLQSKLRSTQSELDSKETEIHDLRMSHTATRITELEERCKSLSEANEQLLKRLDRGGQ